MPKVACPQCDGAHDIEAVEPSFQRPDPFIAATRQDPACEVLEAKDACAYRTSAEPQGRFFLRVLLPFRVEDLELPCAWGVWAEVEERHFNRAHALWDDPHQHREPSFPGTLANSLHGYRETLGLAGTIQLAGPTTIPTFRLDVAQDHRLAREQAHGVSQERVMEWLVPIYHPKRSNPE